jgi:hypothetical protein
MHATTLPMPKPHARLPEISTDLAIGSAATAVTSPRGIPRQATTLPMPKPHARLPEISTDLAIGSAATPVTSPDVPAPRWLARLGLHLALASVPVLAISANVFGWVSLRTVAIGFLLPVLVVTGLVTTREPHPSDRLMLVGFTWGLLACAGYDAFRLPSIYVTHLWGDFFGAVGGWATGTSSNFLVGYVWRYAGDGAGIGVAFFAVAATMRAGAWPYKRVVGAAVAYAVCPVWAGLIVTDLMAPAGRQLFPLTVTTVSLSLIGHLIYGTILGHGYWLSRRHEQHWPLTPVTVRQLLATSSPGSPAFLRRSG